MKAKRPRRTLSKHAAALDYIAFYILPTFTVERAHGPMRVVELDVVEHLREVARTALSEGKHG